MKYLKVIRKKEREKKEKGKSFYVYFLDDYYKYKNKKFEIYNQLLRTAYYFHSIHFCCCSY
jgi:hypothetical protein